MKLLNFEKLDEVDKQKLIGGFSSIFSTVDNFDYQDSNLTNNCHGGNCAAATCKKQKITKEKGKNGNCVGNCVPGCSTKK
ncbi:MULTISPECIES: hypothetical protein [Flavobacterium]|uniref:Uncharacterized protein n=2 Tax=Flavobacterium TaxID=237 RepID=A0AA94F3N6_9FLAO|nr:MULTISPECIES: hypothetical protein [Flavobacterium]OXA74889.1 hypothetical protein B0A56_12020 [Flavobacterium columnare NBRC 100251 = ATCC 23463]AMA49071.1 hypothetical protein AWN65_06170 [Flavobacterium covae]AND64855.1 hypothetical protein AX766_10850 [Flavobacterium covae]MCH4831003.1 hypothetical protein [Flavobacterium columnare]MCH4833056.1 hypothetical protein [Flavobacterium columnare]